MKGLAPDVLRRRRRLKRRGISLRDRAIATKTRIRYFLAVTAILPLLETTSEDIEDFLVEWIGQEYLRGSSITSVADTLSGLHHFLPCAKGRYGPPGSYMGFGEE